MSSGSLISEAPLKTSQKLWVTPIEKAARGKHF
jgi:hypothetical protein